MPMFNFRCTVCERVFEDFRSRDDYSEIPCPACESPSKRLVSLGVKYKFAKMSFFEPYMEENITGEPVLVKSKDHLETLCRENRLKIRRGPEKLL